MKGASNIPASIQHLKMAIEHWDDFTREHPGTKGADLFTGYKKRVEWILRDIITNPYLPPEVIAGIKNELSSDVFAVPDIQGKIALLPPEQRDNIEKIIDLVLKGETLKIVE